MMMYIYNTIKMNWIGKRFILGLSLSFLAALFSTAFYKIVLLLPLNDVWVNIMGFSYI